MIPLPWPGRGVSARRLARWLRGELGAARLLGIAPSRRVELTWQAHRLVEAGRPADALRAFELLESLWPEASAAARLGRGVCLQALNRLDEAEAAYTAALDAEPDHPYALANRAEVRLQLGRPFESRDDLSRIRCPPARLVPRVAALRALADRDGSPSKIL